MATYLAHHGILGQKWGKRNGPPYPLEPSDHSAAEKKAGYTKSLSKDSQNNVDTQHHGLKLSDKQKKALVIGAAAVGTVLVAYGGYKIYKNVGAKNLVNTGKDAVNNFDMQSLDSFNNSNLSFGVDKNMISVARETASKLGFQVSDVPSSAIEKARRINPTKDRMNCGCCVTADLLDDLCGIKAQASGGRFIDPVSGMDTTGRTISQLRLVFEGAPVQKLKGVRSYEDVSNLLLAKGEGAAGILQKHNSGGVDSISHFIKWKVDNGRVVFSDYQNVENWVVALSNEIKSRGQNASESELFSMASKISSDLPYSFLNKSTDFLDAPIILTATEASSINIENAKILFLK